MAEARQLGAAGIQVGTAFAFCDGSGLEPALNGEAIRASRAGTARMFTDPLASPTGFPFKVVSTPGTGSEADRYAGRERICDLGSLRQPSRETDGGLGYRCPAEPAADDVREGGAAADTMGRACLCNALAATVGFGQSRLGRVEPATVTAGTEVAELARIVPTGAGHDRAEKVVRYLRGAETSAAVAVRAPINRCLARAASRTEKGCPARWVNHVAVFGPLAVGRDLGERVPAHICWHGCRTGRPHG